LKCSSLRRAQYPQKYTGDMNLNPALNSGLSDASIDLRTELEADLRTPGALHAHCDLEPAAARRKTSIAARLTQAALLLLTAAFLALQFVHLSADVRGDFNPAVALPVWPLLEFAVFSATGVSLIAARALSVSVFVGIVIAAYVLVRRISVTESLASHRSSLAPAVAATLLAVSPFCFVFSRLAILEPLLILLTLLALIAASSARRGRVLPIVCLGILIPLMVLTKTTAVFLLPSVLWMLWASCGYRVRSFLAAGIPVASIAAGLWSAYFVFVVRPRFLEDYRYLFSANAYTAMTRENAVSVLEATVRDGMWMGGILYPVALAAILAAFVFSRRCFRNPLVPSLMLWAAGYTAFLAYHNNLQPRYYLVVAVPLTLLTPVVVEEILGGIRNPGGSERRFVVPVIPVDRSDGHGCYAPLRPEAAVHLHAGGLGAAQRRDGGSRPQPAASLDQRIGSLTNDRTAVDLRRLWDDDAGKSRRNLPARMVCHLERGGRRQDGRPLAVVSPGARRRVSGVRRPGAQPADPVSAGPSKRRGSGPEAPQGGPAVTADAHRAAAECDAVGTLRPKLLPCVLRVAS
jgi:hypothetical protein